MRLTGTARCFALLVGGYVLLTLPGLFVPGYLDSPLGILIAVPYLSIYLFDMAGIPGLLQNHGLCGWGWCAPTLFGWTFLITVWLAVAWLLAMLLGRLRRGDA